MSKRRETGVSDSARDAREKRAEEQKCAMPAKRTRRTQRVQPTRRTLQGEAAKKGRGEVKAGSAEHKTVTRYGADCETAMRVDALGAKENRFDGDGGRRKVRVLSRIAERLRGLKGFNGDDECAVLVPCRDIQTFGMKGPIDAAFIDAAGSVVAVHRRVMPGRRIRHADARMVVERPFQTGKWLERGDGFFNVAPRV